MTTFTSWDTELYHFGIKGQKWGFRRYQNEDGSYTALGRVHYGIGQKNKNSKELDQYNTTRENLLAAARRVYKKDPDYFYSGKSQDVWNTDLGEKIWRSASSISDLANLHVERNLTDREVLAERHNTYSLGKQLSKRDAKAVSSAREKRRAAAMEWTNYYSKELLSDIEKKVPKQKQDLYKAALYEAYSRQFPAYMSEDYLPVDFIIEEEKANKNR